MCDDPHRVSRARCGDSCILPPEKGIDMEFNKAFWKAASRICEANTDGESELKRRIERYHESAAELSKLLNLISLHEDLVLKKGGGRFRPPLYEALGSVESAIRRIYRQAVKSEEKWAAERKPTKDSVGSVYKDILALNEEFGPAEVNLKSGWIRFLTDPISLHSVEYDRDVDLGSFKVHLPMDDPRSFSIISVDEVEPLSSDHYFHPHVSDEVLCEGAAKDPLNNLFKCNRIYDAVGVIVSTLNTYNPDSPHCCLENWIGEECSECGDTMSRNGFYYCEANCGKRRICGDCTIRCSDGYYCTDCTYECASCGNRHRNGRSVCVHCGLFYSSSERGCRDHESNCQKRPTPEPASRPTRPFPAPEPVGAGLLEPDPLDETGFLEG